MKAGFRKAILLMTAFWLVSSMPAFAEVIVMGFGISKPPYVIQKTNSGVEVDLARRALELSGYEMKPKYMPLLRIPHELNAGNIDGGLNLRATLPIDGFYSDDMIQYRNYAISRADHWESPKKFSDLRGEKIVAFQNAHMFLGVQYADAVKDNPKYSEIANQALQVRMLAAGRVDYVIADFRIFLHFKQMYETETGRKLAVKFHNLFEPTPYRAAFRKRVVRDAFDKGLAQLRASGEYDKIIARYLDVSELKALQN